MVITILWISKALKELMILLIMLDPECGILYVLYVHGVTNRSRIDAFHAKRKTYQNHK